MVGFITKVYSTIALLNPKIEVMLRQLYWRNSKRFSHFNPNRNMNSIENVDAPCRVDFNDIIEQLKEWGVKEGSLLIVHSSYDSLKASGLSPIEIISKLRELVGDTGTIAMPVIRKYKEEPDASQKILPTYIPPKCIYNPRRTPVTSGLLPTFLMRTRGAEISLHPLNPLCAVGPLAKAMMVGNIEGDYPSPHGKSSAWKFCLDHNAFVIGLGTDLRHHNTMGHVAEEAFDDWRWTEDEWYNKRDFIIEKSSDEIVELTVKERKPIWGMLHQAEMNRYRDFLKNGIVKSRRFGPVLVELENSKELIEFLRKRNKKGYPYFK